MQNYSAKCRIRNAECKIIMQNAKLEMQNAKFVVSRLGTCVKMQNQYKTEQNAELEQNKTENRMKKQKTEFRTRT